MATKKNGKAKPVRVDTSRLRDGRYTRQAAIEHVAEVLESVSRVRCYKGYMPPEAIEAADRFDTDLTYLLWALAENPDADRFEVRRDEGEAADAESDFLWLSLAGTLGNGGGETHDAAALAPIVAHLRAEDAKRLGREAA